MRDALRQATPFDLDQDLVTDHHFAAFGRDGVARDQPTRAETQFLHAATHGLATIARSERDPALNATTGHIAESIAATLLAESGWTIIDQQTGDVSAGHGIDLAALAPDAESVFVVEIKGSLSAARWPHLSHREITQFSPAWLDKSDQPGMASLGLEAADVYGLVVAIQFGRGQWRAASTSNFTAALPIRDLGELDDVSWLTESSVDAGDTEP